VEKAEIGFHQRTECPDAESEKNQEETGETLTVSYGVRWDVAVKLERR